MYDFSVSSTTVHTHTYTYKHKHSRNSGFISNNKKSPQSIWANLRAAASCININSHWQLLTPYQNSICSFFLFSQIIGNRLVCVLWTRLTGYFIIKRIQTCPNWTKHSWFGSIRHQISVLTHAIPVRPIVPWVNVIKCHFL